MALQTTLKSTEQALKNFFKGMTDEMQGCIQLCTRCHQACEQLVSHCLSKGGVHAAPAHIGTLRDCASACSLTADYMIRASPLHSQTCELCAVACLECARSCDAIADDQLMKDCADVCRACAESCQRMAVQH